jgi:hypothetical protein
MIFIGTILGFSLVAVIVLILYFTVFKKQMCGGGRTLHDCPGGKVSVCSKEDTDSSKYCNASTNMRSNLRSNSQGLKGPTGTGDVIEKEWVKCNTIMNKGINEKVGGEVAGQSFITLTDKNIDLYADKVLVNGSEIVTLKKTSAYLNSNTIGQSTRLTAEQTVNGMVIFNNTNKTIFDYKLPYSDVLDTFLGIDSDSEISFRFDVVVLPEMSGGSRLSLSVDPNSGLSFNIAGTYSRSIHNALGQTTSLTFMCQRQSDGTWIIFG